MPCDAQMLADVELFEHVSEEDRARLAEFIDIVALNGGDTLFKAGEPGESLYVVRSGEVELFIRDTAAATFTDVSTGATGPEFRANAS